MKLHIIWVSDHLMISVPPHAHDDFYQFIYCKSGEGSVTVSGIEHDMSRGRACIVKPGENHSLTQKNGMHLIEMKFFISDELLDKRVKLLPTYLKLEDNEDVSFRVQRLADKWNKRRIYNIESEASEAFLIFADILWQYGVDSDFSATMAHGASESSNIAFYKVIDYIERHYKEPITLDDLCRVVHFAKSHLTQRFKEKWGIPPIQYVNFVRIEKAKILLKNTDESITDIAKSVGFASIHYFSRHFKQKENLSPGEYRQLSRCEDKK